MLPSISNSPIPIKIKLLPITANGLLFIRHLTLTQSSVWLKSNRRPRKNRRAIPIHRWTCLSAASISVDAWRALPIEHVYQSPGILIEFDLKLAILVNGELARRIQYAGALFLIGVVQIKLPTRKIECRRLSVRPYFSESQ